METPDAPVETAEIVVPLDIDDIARHMPEGFNIDKGTAKALAKIKRQVGSDYSSSIVKGATMICQGPACPWVRDEARTKDPSLPRNIARCMCPLYEIEREPINQACPIESYDATNLLNFMVRSLDIKSTNFGDISIVQEMVGFMMIQRRLMRELAQSPSNLLDDVVIDGEATLLRKQLNPLFGGLQSITKMIAEKRNELMATPDKRHRAKIDKIGAASKVIDAAGRLRDLLQKHTSVDPADRKDIMKAALEVEPQVIEKDEEILRMQQHDLERAGIRSGSLEPPEPPDDDDAFDGDDE